MNITKVSPVKNFSAGISAQTGTATLVFTIPHNHGTLPAYVNVTSHNALSAALFYLTWDSTNITVTFAVGLTGTVALSWMAIS